MTLWQLCYTRGSVIPCSLSISCRDAQGLDLLSMPRAIDIRLERHISMDFDAGRQYSYGLAYETATLDVQSAVWWPMSSGANNRLLMGEIHLARDLKYKLSGEDRLVLSAVFANEIDGISPSLS